MAEGLGQALVNALKLGESAPDWSRNSDFFRRRTTEVLTNTSCSGEEAFHQYKYVCESPIECLALAALLVLFPNAVVADSAKEMKGRDDWLLCIVPQMKIHGYRLDFGILNRFTKAVYDLECDGRDYHSNKTRDCNRDVVLWGHGIMAFHVSGSALCRDPIAALEPLRQKVLHP